MQPAMRLVTLQQAAVLNAQPRVFLAPVCCGAPLQSPHDPDSFVLQEFTLSLQLFCFKNLCEVQVAFVCIHLLLQSTVTLPLPEMLNTSSAVLTQTHGWLEGSQLPYHCCITHGGLPCVDHPVFSCVQEATGAWHERVAFWLRCN